MTDRPSWSPDAVDPTRPSVARVHDRYLGGHTRSDGRPETVGMARVYDDDRVPPEVDDHPGLCGVGRRD